ncbi:hypothetical protein [Candidatus Methylobacter oryzae]|nr:hypothetical protein [Candidatus Methylobacter oryzae]
MIIQAQKKKKVFRTFEMPKIKPFKPLDTPEAWLALLKLSANASSTPHST